jgi:hypothetical protein
LKEVGENAWDGKEDREQKGKTIQNDGIDTVRGSGRK